MDDAALTKHTLAHLGQVPGWAWHEDGSVYAAGEVGLSYGAIGPEPDRAIGARVYGGSDSPGLRWRRLQLRIRGGREDPAGADRLADLAHAVLSGLSLTDGSGVTHVTRQSFSPQGADGNGREERTDNYIIILDNREALL